MQAVSTPGSHAKRTASDETEIKAKRIMMSHPSTTDQPLSFTKASSLIKNVINAKSIAVEAHIETIPMPEITDEDLLLMANMFEKNYK